MTKIGVNSEDNAGSKGVYGTTIEVGQPSIYTDGDYSVYIGRMASENDKVDMDHYLVINDCHGVIEGSFNRLLEARATAWGLAEAQHEQDTRINSALPLIDKEAAQQTATRNKTWN